MHPVYHAQLGKRANEIIITTPHQEQSSLQHFIMALQLKRRNYKLTTAATGALLIGAGFMVFKTFPHLTSALCSAFGSSKSEPEEDNTPIEITEIDEHNASSTLEKSYMDESLVDIANWSDDNLKSYLVEVSTNKTNLISKTTNSFRKKSVLLPMLLMMVLFPLFSRFKRVLNINFVIFFAFKEMILKLILKLRDLAK